MRIAYQQKVGERTRLQYLLKRLLDYSLAGGALLLLLPVLLLVALAIWLDDRGPILFCQQRLGRDGKPFWIFKFRTMVVDAERRLSTLERYNESAGGVLFKMKDDPRVTRIGRFLRRTSLDELPQLLNVWLGQMSLVGPRPLQQRDCDLALQQYPDLFRRRLAALPGITGPWQAGGRSELGFEQMLMLDIAYIEQWSLWLDVKLLLKTVLLLLTPRGAY